MEIKMCVLLKSYGVKIHLFCWLVVYSALGEKEEKNWCTKRVGR